MGDSNQADVVCFVDMRSDTVTKPTKEMRQAAMNAEVDDDVIGVDPSCAALENYVADLYGKEAGLFVPSGTMSNLVAVLTHCPERGSECILGSMSHIHIYEQGGIATLGGVHPRTVPNKKDGTLDIDEVIASIRDPTDSHSPITRLVCIENTHNKCGGRVLTLDYLKSLGEMCNSHGIKLHMDGARSMNACAALDCTPAQLAEHCDSVSVCISKALGAPVGSVLVGSKEFIKQAYRNRKVLGGAMRQNGVIAAMALYGIKTFQGGNLRNDHENAKIMAKALHSMPHLQVDLENVESNIIRFTTGNLEAKDIVDKMKEKGILVNLQGKHNLRVCTHHQVSRDGIYAAIAAFKEVLSAME